MNKDDVNVAFEMLLEEIENIFSSLDSEREKFSKSKDYEKANEVYNKISKLSNYCIKVKELQKEWDELFSGEVVEIQKRKKRKKLKKGLRTPDEEFIIPILESLIELGGKEKMSKVLEKVYYKMKNKLNEYDYEYLPSGKIIRWKNTAQWCRNQLIQQGLMSKDSPFGIWEITKEGIEYYNKNK
ncbi:MAG TPA: winged helix-turn-helix domain-containing protein [Caldisericia bacterium]|nr:winged helix-turn-helix domain-containing protein [Caldisericia bacterium]HQL67321.1 winged helix-turn-helix domain-containing protein [Caldisericia bacterium]HQN48792.1 winged helix-turn-helix domain-containing protein [Caldisericia bacterium]HQO99670.1 winged helix-turn-helix domain-containing protein [Caldisericia bacterium]